MYATIGEMNTIEEMCNNNILVAIQNLLRDLKHKVPVELLAPTPNEQLNECIKKLVKEYLQ